MSSVKYVYIILHIMHANIMSSVKYVYIILHIMHANIMSSVKYVYIILHIMHANIMSSVKYVYTRGSLAPEGVLTTFPKGFCQTAIWGQEGLIPIITYPTIYRHMLKYFLN